MNFFFFACNENSTIIKEIDYSNIPPATEYTLDRGEKCTQVAEPRWPPRSPRRVKAIVTAIESLSLGEK